MPIRTDPASVRLSKRLETAEKAAERAAKTAASTTPVLGAASPDPTATAPDDPAVDAPKGDGIVVPSVEPSLGSAFEVAAKVEKKLLGTIDSLKSVDGTGQEQAGKGDSRVTTRRSALSTILTEKNSWSPGLGALSKQIAEDIKWLKNTDFRDFELVSTSGYGSDSQFDTKYYSYNVSTKFNSRLTAGKSAAEAVDKGTKPFVDVADGSVISLAYLPSGQTRQNVLADSVLQFRGRADKAIDATKWSADSSSNQTRIDELGPVNVAEQRIVLQKADLSKKNADAGLEFALLRELIGSHPTSSVNGIFEARNAVAQILMDGGDNWDSKTHDTAWIRYEVPPGATASAYSSIHHNFSRDTPKNITAMVEHWLFPGAPLTLKAGGTVTNSLMFMALTDALQAAGAGDAKAALRCTALLDGLKPGEPRTDALLGLGAALKHANGDAKAMAAALLDHLTKAAVKPLGKNPTASLLAAATTFRSVCQGQFTEADLEKELFRGGPAITDLAQLMICLDNKDDAGALRQIGEARQQLKQAVIDAPEGYKRQQYLLLDAKLQRMQTEMLGSTVEAVGALDTPEQRGLALVGLQSAVRGALAAGIDQLKLKGDDAAKGRGLAEFSVDLDKIVSAAATLGAGAKVTAEEFRGVMCEASVLIKKTIQNMRSFYDSRAATLATNNVPLDPMFMDQLIKQSPLHYATALCEKGMRVGLEEKITARSVENVTGMRVLNGIGPVVFSSVVIAENGKDLQKMGVSKDQLAVLLHLEEKKMVAVGGMFVDSQHAPGGNSHLNMYAMNNGIPVVALPELRTKYATFFENAAKEGGVYVDDTDGNFRMLTVQKAVEDGLIPGAKVGDAASIKSAVEGLRPGMNRNIKFLKPTADGLAHEVLSKHDAIISPQRGTREVELYIPQDSVRGVGLGVTTFADVAKLGIHGRHIAGEKGTVLALLRTDPALAAHVPDGSQVTPGAIDAMLAKAPLVGVPGQTLKDLWDGVWNNDPIVGITDDKNFLKSKFYTDKVYRSEKRQALQEETLKGLTSHFLGDDGKTLSADGKALYEEMMLNPSLSDNLNGSNIYRSSFTGEDRPGKSGAGQYESYVDRKMAEKMYGKDVVNGWFAEWQPTRDAVTSAEKVASQLGLDISDLTAPPKPMKDGKMAAPDLIKSAIDAIAKARVVHAAPNALHNERLGPARVASVIGVIESTWMPEPVENNVAEQFFLPYIGPTIATQACVKPDISGVVISRNLETGGRGEVTFQLVKGFGGGVDGGKATEGVISQGSIAVGMVNGEAKTASAVEVQGIAVADEDMKKLREIVLKTEKFFHDQIEPGKGYAVDMEVARQDGVWMVVQARVILVDK